MASFCLRKYSPAMKINKTNFAITGAAALFVGLAGTAQAIPTPAHVVQPIVQNGGNRLSAGLILRMSAAQAKASAKKTKTVPILASGSTLGSIPMPSLTLPEVSGPVIATGLVIKPVVPAAAPISSVPDGGATGAMLGGTFGGLALLRKKLKA
jgi:hypothetical protein